MMRHDAPYPWLTQTCDRLFDAYWYGEPAERYLAIELADPRGIGGDEWRVSVWRYGNRSNQPDAVEWAGTKAEAKRAGYRLLDDVNEEKRNPRLVSGANPSISAWTSEKIQDAIDHHRFEAEHNMEQARAIREAWDAEDWEALVEMGVLSHWMIEDDPMEGHG